MQVAKTSNSIISDYFSKSWNKLNEIIKSQAGEKDYYGINRSLFTAHKEQDVRIFDNGTDTLELTNSRKTY